LAGKLSIPSQDSGRLYTIRRNVCAVGASYWTNLGRKRKLGGLCIAQTTPHANGLSSGVLEASLKDLPQQLPVKPKAILVVSGHWEENDFAVMASPAPPMVYDFGGFPKELYQIRYSAPGSPELARQAHSLIQGAGLPTHLDPKRGFDHGTYSLLAVTHPEADVPVIQVSVR
jgi:aromatic ring-opening dioxygenase catalytic subunit (LigB family)